MHVAAIWRYPVKSMGGESLSHSQVTRAGIVGDRRYAVLDLDSGNIASAKRPAKWASLLQCTARYVVEPMQGEVLPPLEITFPDGSVHRSDDPVFDVRLSTFMRRPVSLISQVPEDARSEVIWRVMKGQEATPWIRERTVAKLEGCDLVEFELGAATPEVEGEKGFVDISPMHVISTATLRKFETLAPGVRFDPRRYRPNVVVDIPGESFAEDGWVGSQITMGPLPVDVVTPTPRCVMSTLAHGDVPVDRRTLKAIIRHNTLALDFVSGNWACAGVYVNPTRAETISVGDPVLILSGAAPQLEDEQLKEEG
ncbi:MOSC domain-containing protein [Rhodococcus erythropolis]|uniref:MOSC domain-containing protein n=1 Tax=Rhodococcus erythropolis TaxID=1833 RepID=UPI001C9B5846|nr:MOSC N-terminal beta barrel domain-containing protein [Rhodococcus erythropolis]MBY6382491.1 MOSC domain-containing protein [Rhodococcus erythropolis]